MVNSICCLQYICHLSQVKSCNAWNLRNAWSLLLVKFISYSFSSHVFVLSLVDIFIYLTLCTAERRVLSLLFLSIIKKTNNLSMTTLTLFWQLHQDGSIHVYMSVFPQWGCPISLVFPSAWWFLSPVFPQLDFLLLISYSWWWLWRMTATVQVKYWFAFCQTQKSLRHVHVYTLVCVLSPNPSHRFTSFTFSMCVCMHPCTHVHVCVC